MEKGSVFSEDYLSNQIFSEQPAGFRPVEPERIGMVSDAQAKAHMGTRNPGISIRSGAFVRENGDVEFRIYAPNIDQVEIYLLAMDPKPRIRLTKGEDGMHTAVYPYDPEFCGPMSMDIYFDGTLLLYPYIPVFWHRDRPVNFIEIPDPETDYILMRKVPHGTMAREYFWSDIFSNHQRCFVYTPPGYEKGTESYPVLYLQAGGGENETTWEFNGRVAHILDNLLAEGKCVPFILVTCDGGVQYAEKLPGRGSAIPAFRDMLLGEVIPFIESKYRVKADKWNRAMAGLSRGSHQTSSIGFPHPEVFGYLGMFSGFMSEPGEPGSSEAELAILRDPERFAKEYKVVFRSMGENDHLLPHFLADDKTFQSYGLDKLPNYHRILYARQKHTWGAWRRAIYDFAQLIFRA